MQKLSIYIFVRTSNEFKIKSKYFKISGHLTSSSINSTCSSRSSCGSQLVPNSPSLVLLPLASSAVPNTDKSAAVNEFHYNEFNLTKLIPPNGIPVERAHLTNWGWLSSSLLLSARKDSD